MRIRRRRSFGLGNWLGFSVLALGCGRPATCEVESTPPSAPHAPTEAAPGAEDPPAAPGAVSSASSSSVPQRAPLRAATPLVEIQVPDHGPAVVSLPLGATEPRPVLVATHGNYDRPEWTCSIWRDIVENDGFVLCPRGVAREDSPSRDDLRYHYLTNAHLEREIEQALASLDESYKGYVAPAPHAYGGFSQGAIMGVPILGRRPQWFDRAVLIEGGFDRWSKPAVTAYAAGGGRRVLFVCGQWACDRGARVTEPWFEAAGIDARVLFAKGAGHAYDGEVAALAARAWGWFVAGDPRWPARPDDTASGEDER